MKKKQSATRSWSILMAGIFILFLSHVFSQKGFSQQDSSRFEFRGYISNMQSVIFENPSEDLWITDNLFHNRLNFYLYPFPGLTASIQVRNRFIYGPGLYFGDMYPEENEFNYLQLSGTLFEGRSFRATTGIDRLYVQYTREKISVTAGRQRINWGQCFVWNPNDIFNIQNFFDFDYVEKQGSDALRIQYYPGYSSSIEVAAKLNREGKVTAAGYFRFSSWSYDFQVLGGILDEEDFLAGIGWSGDILGAGFRGESGYFHPVENSRDTTGSLFTAVSADYTFPGSLYIQAEVLHQYDPSEFNLTGLMDFYQGPLTVKKMAFSKWNFFLQGSYPISPLLNLNVSGMYFPDLKGFYTGPGLNYSLKENAELSLMAQYFRGEFAEPPLGEPDMTSLFFGFLRYKFDF